jgi:hypothetical protein
MRHIASNPAVERLEARRLLSAELVPTFAGRLPAQLPPDGTSDILVRLTDAGKTAASGSATVRLFASATRAMAADAVPLASSQVNLRLHPGQQGITRLTFPTPTTLNADYYLLAEVDGSAMVTASAKPLSIDAPFSDVAIKFAALPTRPIAIDGLAAGRRSATVDVTDAGNIPVRGQVDVSLYLSNGSVLDASDPLLATVDNRSINLRPGTGAPVRIHIALPAGTVPGRYFLIAKVTPLGNLLDSNTADNVLVSSRHVLVVTKLSAKYRNGHGGEGGVGGGEISGSSGGYGCESSSGDDDSSDQVDTSTDDSGDDSGDDSSSQSDDSSSQPTNSSPTTSHSSGDDSSDSGDSGDSSDSGDSGDSGDSSDSSDSGDSGDGGDGC